MKNGAIIFTSKFKKSLKLYRIRTFKITRNLVSKKLLDVYFCFEFRAGRIYAASVSLGDQVIVFGGHLGHNGNHNLGPTNLIG